MPIPDDRDKQDLQKIRLFVGQFGKYSHYTRAASRALRNRTLAGLSKFDQSERNFCGDMILAWKSATEYEWAAIL